MKQRTIAWWSAGVASATAAKLMLDENPETIIAYCDTSSTEHPDNLRFLRDCERWYGKKILRLRSERYTDIWDVFEKTRWLVGVRGARCTLALKKNVREAFQEHGDVHVFGFTTKERPRAERFCKNSPEIEARFPLLENFMGHLDCQAFVVANGIEIPAMYRLGYRNNNCIGCVKGGMGYWNKIRVDFPHIFERMARIERKIGAAINKRYVNGQRIRVFLDQLPPDAGNYRAEPAIECGAFCQINWEY